MTALDHDDYVRRVRDSLAVVLGETSSERLALVGEPVKRARSTTYFFGHGTEQPKYVVKKAVLGKTALDTTPALTSAEQFRALMLAHGWFQSEDRHAAVRPLAFFEELDALAMEFVAGRPFRRTVRRVLLDPPPALRAAAAAGDALRRLHRQARVSEAPIDLRDLATEVRELATSVLQPVGLSLPDDVRSVLDDVPSRVSVHDRVLLHGDYGPNNLILMDSDTVTMIDPSLVEAGLAEDDLARFLAVLSSYSIFVAEPVVPRARRLRRELERAFRLGYGAAETDTAVMELRLLKQHVLRWRRRREFSRLASYQLPMRVRQQVIDPHMRRLVTESGQRLSGFLSG